METRGKWHGNGEKSCCFRVCGGRGKLMQRPPLIFAAGGETICSGRWAPSNFDFNYTMASLSQWIKFSDFGYKDTHFPPHFGRKKCIFATTIYSTFFAVLNSKTVKSSGVQKETELPKLILLQFNVICDNQHNLRVKSCNQNESKKILTLVVILFNIFSYLCSKVQLIHVKHRGEQLCFDPSVNLWINKPKANIIRK